MSLQDIRQLKLVSKIWYLLFQEDYTWLLLCQRMGFLNMIPSPELEKIKLLKGWKWLYLSKVYSTHSGCFIGRNIDNAIVPCVRKHSHKRCKCNIYKPYAIGYENYVDERDSLAITRYEGDWNMSTRNGFGVLTTYDKGSVYIGEFRNGLKSGKGCLYLVEAPRHKVKNIEIIFGWKNYNKQLNEKTHYGMFPLKFTFKIKGTWKNNKLHGFCKIINLKEPHQNSKKFFYFENKRWKI